jgi:YteA family regulatory protein
VAEKRPGRRDAGGQREVRAWLRGEEERLRAEIDSLEATGLDESFTESFGELSAYDNHPADVGTEMFERSKDLALRENLELRLAQVERAEERLAEGKYGLCEVCGAAIDPERLEAKPEATTCLSCQEERDSVERNPVERGQGGRPVEEDVLHIGLAFGPPLDPDENNAFDGEDAWQAVARYGTANSPQDVPDAINYNDTFYNADSDTGLVEETDAILDPSPDGSEAGELTDEFYQMGDRDEQRRPHVPEWRGTEPD